MRLVRGLLPAFLAATTSSATDQSPLRNFHRGSFETYTNPDYSTYSLRIKEQNDSICDAGSKQYTGWLDANGKHIFFWYVESLNDPKQDPLTLWMTGGPGVSGLVGMMLELGPCLVDDGGEGTHRNPYSWTRNSSMIFVDQPAGTGFSYVDTGVEIPGDSFVSAQDMYIFLQVFLTKAFPDKRDVPFHIAGESYGGHYVPALSVEIVRQNSHSAHKPQIRLQSILVGNGYVSPLDTTYGYYETLCTTKPGMKEPVFNDTRCDIIADELPRCLHVYEACYSYRDASLCQAATQVCARITELFHNETGAGGRDPFDLTRTCEVDHICYAAVLDIQKYANLNNTWDALAVPSEVGNYSVESQPIISAFDAGIDGYIDTMDHVKFTLEHGVDVLVYNGNLDLSCNSAGNLRWTNALRWKGQAPFVSQDLQPWFSAVDGQSIKGGTYKEVYATAAHGTSRKQRFAFVTVDNSGHMVPLSQPAVASDLYQRWLFGKPFGSDE